MTNSTEGSAEPASSEKPKAAARSGSAWPSVIAIILALAALGIGGFAVWQLDRLSTLPGKLNSATNNYADLNDQLNQLRQLQNNQQEALRELEAMLDEASAEFVEMPLRLEQVETLVKGVPGINARSKADWLSAEALYYLKLANAQIVLTGNTEVAASALKLADEKLLESGDPRMIAVRARLSDDITALRAIPMIDRAGISFRLQSLISQAPDWPFRVEAPASFRPDVAMPNGEAGAWDRVKETFAAVFSSIISVKKVEGEPLTEQLGVNERALILESVKAELQIARLALLANNDELFKQSIENSANQINLYFDADTESVEAVLAALAELSATAFPGPVPDISESLAMFLAIGESQ